MAKSWQLNLDLDKVRDASHDAAVRGLRTAAEHVLQVSRSRVPIEEGTLERSGAVDVDEEGLRAAISYDTPYAVVQHEDMTLQHDAGRQAKYLESAMTGERETALQLIAAEIRRATT